LDYTKEQMVIQQQQLVDFQKLHIENETKLKQLELENERQDKELLAIKSKKYEEIQKSGSNQTDATNYFRNGMTLKETKKRISGHQTSNEKEVIILKDFKTSQPKLLEALTVPDLSIKNY
jgi:hypothetical protein